MKYSVRVAILVLIAAVVLVLAGWIVTVVLFKSGGRVEEPQPLALQLSR